MTCKNTSCKYEWCWVCSGPWKDHNGSYYSCNKFDPEKDKETDGGKQKDSSRVALERYLHYYTRFNNHHNSLKFEVRAHRPRRRRGRSYERSHTAAILTPTPSALSRRPPCAPRCSPQIDAKAKMEAKIKEMESLGDNTWMDCLYLNEANEALHECRYALKFTYVFAFYLSEEGNFRDHFEMEQKMLEMQTEELAEHLEKGARRRRRTAPALAIAHARSSHARLQRWRTFSAWRWCTASRWPRSGCAI